MRKIMAVIGSPGTGKTTLTRKFMEGLEWDKQELVKLVPSMYNAKHDLHVIGKYEDGEIFAGTDKLSLAVQPEAIKFFKETKSNIYFEGDRLSTMSFLEFCSELPETELSIILMKAPIEVLSERYKERGSEQSEVFLKGRATKYANIETNFDLASFITEEVNADLDDQARILASIKSFFGV